MDARVPTPRAGVASPSKPVALVLAMTAIVLLFVAEMAAPRTLTLGTAVIVPVLVSCFVLDQRWAIAVLGLAVLTRIAAAVVGDTTLGLAALEVTSYVGCAAIAIAYVRRDRSIPTRAPFAAVLPPRSEPTVSPGSLGGAGLTDRERQVLDMTIHGLTAKQIGERLFIGRRTVETHLGRAREKLGVRTKRDLIALTYDRREQPESGSRVPRGR
jgi:DNA-binding CsgD family transcriptional regulator